MPEWQNCRRYFNSGWGTIYTFYNKLSFSLISKHFDLGKYFQIPGVYGKICSYFFLYTYSYIPFKIFNCVFLYLWHAIGLPSEMSECLSYHFENESHSCTSQELKNCLQYVKQGRYIIMSTKAVMGQREWLTKNNWWVNFSHEFGISMHS